MDLHVFLIVLMAALAHATWNAFIKVDGERMIFMTVMVAAAGAVALASLPLVDVPAQQSWPYIALSIALHQGYMACLILAYRAGELSHVYPLARGSAPLMVAVASVAWLHEQLSTTALIAVAAMGLGIMSLSLTRGAQNLRNPVAVAFALATGGFIAAYTVTDGLGARLAGSAHGYAAWMMALEWIPIAVTVAMLRGRAALGQMARVWKPAVCMGVLSLAAYWAVIWAMTMAPIALVAALRETSIVFAVLFGVVILKERLSLLRLAATAATLAGAVLIRARPQ